MSDHGLATMTEPRLTSQDTFRDFYDANVHRVVALAISLTGDHHAAEDVAQDAFVRAHRNWERISQYDDPGAWIRRVAANLATSRWRRLQRETRALARLGAREETQPEMEPTNEEFWATVRRLPRRQAIALALHYVDDRPIAEIANILDTTYAATRSLLERGRARLATTLKEVDA